MSFRSCRLPSQRQAVAGRIGLIGFPLFLDGRLSKTETGCKLEAPYFHVPQIPQENLNGWLDGWELR